MYSLGPWQIPPATSVTTLRRNPSAPPSSSRSSHAMAYVCTFIEDVSLTVSKFAPCVADINTWLSACRLQLNVAMNSCCDSDCVSCWTRLTVTTSWCSARTLPSQTPVTSSVLSSTVSCHQLAVHVTAVCRSSYNQFCQLWPVCHQDARPGVHLMSSGLLQLTTVRHQRWTTLLPPVDSECCHPPGHSLTGASHCDHITPMAAALAASPSASCACTSVTCWSSSCVPRRWENDCCLLSDDGRRPLWSNSSDMWSCSCCRHIINLVIGASRPPVLDCGMILHPDCGS